MDNCDGSGCDLTANLRCGKMHRDTGFQCTRRRDHDGEHIACGYTVHNMKVWAEEENDG